MKEKLQRWSERLGIEWEMELAEEEKAAAILLLLIHKGFNNSVWGSKRLRYWGAFEGKLEKCTLEIGDDNLAAFLTAFANEMSARVGRNQEQREIAAEIVWCGKSQEIMDTIRREIKLLVVLVQVLRDAIKAQYDAPDEEEMKEVELS